MTRPMTRPMTRLMTRYFPSATIGLLTLGCFNLWSATVLVTDVMFAGQTQADTSEWKPNLSTSAERGNVQKPIDAYKQILSRPVFFKTREPYVPPPTPQPISKAVPSGAISDPGFLLAGVTITSEMKKAYIFTRANNSGIWANEGDDFMGWKVLSVKETSVRLEQSGRVIDVQLYPPN